MAKWKTPAAPSKKDVAAGLSAKVESKAVKKEVHPSRSNEKREWNPHTFFLSQSTYKNYLKHILGKECGKVFIERDLLKDPRFKKYDTKAQDLGKYFEAVATGYNPEGIKPEKYSRDSSNKDGDFNKGDLKAEYVRAEQQAAKFKAILEKYGLEIVEVGRFLQDEKTRISALLDVVVRLPEELKEFWDRIAGTYYMTVQVNVDGSKEKKTKLKSQPVPNYPSWEEAVYVTEEGEVHQGCIVTDLKFSALMDDKWNEMGWHPDFVSQRDHRIQAHTYEAVTGLPFFFFVASSKDDDVNFIRSLSEPEQLQKHVAEMNQARLSIIRKMALPGLLEHNPSMKRCSTCPITECTERMEVPPIIGVHFIE